jgi:pilus assembly protein CpaF
MARRFSFHRTAVPVPSPADDLCDARLLDGSRFNVAIRPVAVDGPLVSIRKFSKKPLHLNRLVEVDALRP